MRSYARHQLKQDSFTTSTAETISWAVENRSKLTAAIIVLVVIVAALLGGWAYINYRNQQASSQLAQAIEKYNAPIRSPEIPASPNSPSFASAQERSKVSNAEFTQIANKYPFTQSAAVARYFAGVTFHDLGDNTSAENDLKQVSDSRYKEIGSLAKVALAAIYQDTNHNTQAIELYKQLIDHPTVSVGKNTAQFMLASLYESMAQTGEARHIYEQMQKESPTGAAAQIAGQRLQALAKQ
ncbi:MAG: tetratricopeptide repeat protein [Candidatus Korobacteraceae bacterium]